MYVSVAVLVRRVLSCNQSNIGIIGLAYDFTLEAWKVKVGDAKSINRTTTTPKLNELEKEIIQ